MSKKENIKIEGVVTDACKGTFKVDASGHEIQCTLSGKIRQNSIKVLIGDSVEVEVSPYDLSKGRIIYRKK